MRKTMIVALGALILPTIAVGQTTTHKTHKHHRSTSASHDAATADSTPAAEANRQSLSTTQQTQAPPPTERPAETPPPSPTTAPTPAPTPGADKETQAPKPN